MSFTLDDLPYPADALAPVMSTETLELHHGKHHRAYVTKLNELVPGSEFDGLSLDDLVVRSFRKADAIFNNAGQHWNHRLFWSWMKPGGGGAMPGELERRIVDSFGSVDAFTSGFVAEGTAQFGSGWVWLTEEADGRLALMRTPNGENPLAHGRHALLGCDVWEHAYYVDYRNRRPDYLKAFVGELVDWEAVAARLGGAKA
ncbi:superoxide dismutase [Azospirillum sp. ST 5-10]|uniref:superoxide dismutase n=1 Tax=unclassified Azospirillum TaxID=2630922 RepID=UPI003F49F4EF